MNQFKGYMVIAGRGEWPVDLVPQPNGQINVFVKGELTNITTKQEMSEAYGNEYFGRDNSRRTLDEIWPE